MFSLCRASFTQHCFEIHPTSGSLFLFLAVVVHYMPQFIHSSIDGSMGCFWFLTIMNNGALTILIVYFGNTCFCFLWVNT